MMDLDRFDIEILDILQKDNMTSQRDIGDKIGLSAAAVQRRIKKMREEKVIRADISVINPEEVASQILLFVEVDLDTDKIEFIDEIKNTFSQVPQVQQCYYVTGEVDFILIMVVKSMQEYESLIRKLFLSNSNIRRFKTFVNMHTVKAGLQIPLPKKDFK
ncbi:Lrp/AsnC family transcriptional regulator [Empedobacter falsenii]|uniref:Lrp/AsnC family transcriptional regulator n=3 Tax=Pseudomonadati TaxID=3379134 RepID=A0A7H9DRB4_9FLAO|nr:Lrp/AsnC family transcriptional regulator [uncultured Empedobacter sp.]MDM1550610.1 Lrp/AsnC family transcriptional regulator [Empedobacter falsenii]QLL57271.1 Lrp/AsnC family transcriptional regulator [Empedobacter falsenii]HCC93613.1 AsnC family transcriptional regulator [Flavobacteriaceae bacterium]